jgi:DNA polymerase I
MNEAKHDGPTWLLFDANNHVHRDYHAAGAKGVALFMRRLTALRDKFQADRVVCCFDSRQSFRREFEPTYKSNRDETPAEISEALAALQNVLLTEQIDALTVPGFEADDLIATLATMAMHRGCRAILASTDKDLRQILSAGRCVQLLSAKRTCERFTFEWMNADDVKRVYGVEPWQWADYQTMVGDKVDGIEGAKGIGPEVARKVLQGCHTLDGYYQNQWAAPITQRQHAILANFRDTYKAVRRLVTLRRDVPLPSAWHEHAPEAEAAQ